MVKEARRKASANAMAFWEDTLRYLYLPRLKNRDVFAHAIRSGAKSRDFFGTAYGRSGEKFDGFQFGDASVQFDDTLLLIKPEAAERYEEAAVKITVDIAAEFPDGATDQVKRAVSENARSLDLKSADWE